MVKYEPILGNENLHPPGTSLVSLIHPYYMHRDHVSLALFDEHRFAFYFWVLWSQEQQGSVDLITLDWHQDLVYPENYQKEELEALDIGKKFEISFYTWARLSKYNDSHIMSAAYKNIIGDVYVICKQHMNCENYDEHIIDMYGKVHTIRKFLTIFEAYDYLKKTNINKVFFDIDLDFFTIENISCSRKTTFIKETEIKQIIDSQSDFMWWIMKRIKGFTIAFEPKFTGGYAKSMRLFSIIEKTLFTGSVLNDTSTWQHLKIY